MAKCYAEHGFDLVEAADEEEEEIYDAATRDFEALGVRAEGSSLILGRLP